MDRFMDRAGFSRFVDIVSCASKNTCNRRPPPVLSCYTETVSTLVEPLPVVNIGRDRSTERPPRGEII